MMVLKVNQIYKSFLKRLKRKGKFLKMKNYKTYKKMSQQILVTQTKENKKSKENILKEFLLSHFRLLLCEFTFI